jgi:response regulator of citrate/malate metabolism
MVVEITREFTKADYDYQIVGTAQSGGEAVALVEQHHPDLVLLDNYLPDFNGTEVIERVRAFDKNVDFIIITAAKEVPLVQECFRLGIRDYLIKPYLKQRFLQALLNYKQFYATLKKETLSQADLDKIAISGKADDSSKKGFSQITEEKIVEIIQNRGAAGITAEEIAMEVGITSVSARRYLKLLQDKRMVDYDLIYGKQGRPTYLFKPAK